MIHFNECIKKKLLPFIAERDVFFWPNLENSHHASRNIEFSKVEKNNAPNVSLARPIEKLWARTPATNFTSLKRIVKKVNKLAQECGEMLMKHTRHKFCQIGKGGVYVSLKIFN
jgi:hypothetical protein